MKKCPKVLIRFFLNKGLIFTIFCVLSNNSANCQIKFKFKELPGGVRFNVIWCLEKALSDTTQVNRTFMRDSTLEYDSLIRRPILIKFTVQIDTSKANLNMVRIECTGSMIPPDTTNSPYKYSKGYETVARLNYVCGDKKHIPHHFAQTLAEMDKLKKKYHCKIITTLIIDD